MSEHRTILLYVPAKLPEDILHEFVITHRDGDTGQDAWQLLLTLAAVRENPLAALIHRLWLEVGGDSWRRIGEVTEEDLMKCAAGLKERAAQSDMKKAEEEIVSVRDTNGHPTLVFRDSAGVEVTVLLSEVQRHVESHSPFLASVMLRSCLKWQRMKVGGEEP